MGDYSKYIEILNRNGLKNTKHRKKILEILDSKEFPVSAEDIYLDIKMSDSNISLSTVYRAIEALLNKDIIVKVNIRDENKGVYEINNMLHKHHIICRLCHKMVSVLGCPLDAFEEKINKETGFKIEGHNLELYGLCPGCNKKESPVSNSE
ncbi:UNVERIFIED_CONTAM: Fur family ferric uptake transcriptional regulator [Acetivibrio alkalicellulosi]